MNEKYAMDIFSFSRFFPVGQNGSNKKLNEFEKDFPNITHSEGMSLYPSAEEI